MSEASVLWVGSPRVHFDHSGVPAEGINGEL